MKKIRVKFTDFHRGFTETNNIIYILLSRMYDVELSDYPDYLFYGPFGDEHLKYLDVVRIFYTGENICPDFNLSDYAIGFEYLEYGDRYLRYPTYLAYIYRDDLAMMMNRSYISDVEALKRDFCSFVYSNSAATKERTKLFRMMGEYKPISSGGGYMNNVGGPVKDKIDFQRGYKFCIACENASHSGYTTEKIMQAFASHAIPIYWGDPDVAKVFNPKAFINCHMFESFEDVVRKVIQLDQDEEKYLDMLHELPIIDQKNLVDSMDEQLSAFLKHIIDQDYEKAKRYSRDYWCGKYAKRRIDEAELYQRKLDRKEHKNAWKKPLRRVKALLVRAIK